MTEITEPVEELEPEAQPEPEPAPEPEPEQPASYAERQEAKARANGWVPEEEWIAQGRDPDQWVSPEGFNIKSPLVREIKTLRKERKEFDERVNNLNMLHEASLEVQRNALLADKNKAIELGGAEGVAEVAAIDKQLASLSQQPPPAVNGVPDEIQRWNDENPWIEKPGAKTTYARSLYAEGVAAGKTPSQIIDYVNAGIAREFPPTKPKASISEGASPSSFNKQDRALTMSDCTPEELKAREILPGRWKTDAAFLKAVKDARKKDA